MPHPSTPWTSEPLEALSRTGRRYRAPALPASLDAAEAGGPSTALAVAIEQARAALAGGLAPEPAVRRLFLDALARLIREAMRPIKAQDDASFAAGGDPAFQAMVLRHRSAVVREFASLGAHAERDRRAVRAAVNALAHPAKTQRRPPGATRDALSALHAAAEAGEWARLSEVATRLRTHADVQIDVQADATLWSGLTRLADDAALTRLRRLDALSSEALVGRYRTLWERQGPLAGSEPAAARGAGAQRRGDAVEAQAAATLAVLVDRPNVGDARPCYRLATSLRVPPSFPGDAQRAKSEWDVALLRRHARADDVNDAWDILLLVEAKASPDAATTDLPRLLRGLRLLAQADLDTVYTFAAHEGELRLHGASLSALPTEEADLARAVLYCCDGPEERAPRLINAASRMQLLSAEASLDFGALLEDGEAADPSLLLPVWQLLLEAPAFSSVLRQYVTLRAVRELMIHPDDLLAALRA